MYTNTQASVAGGGSKNGEEGVDTTRVMLPDDLLLQGNVLHLDTDAAGAAVCVLCLGRCCWYMCVSLHMTTACVVCTHVVEYVFLNIYC